MATTDVDKQNPFTDPDREGSNDSNSVQSNDANSTEDNLEDAIPDLDGDGMIGNTGGFYGGTSYLGSNYTEEWSAKAGAGGQNEGNFGAADVSDLSDDSADENTTEKSSEQDDV